MRRALMLISGLLFVMAVATGCGKKQEAAQESMVDSLLAASPTEQTSGDLTPQTEYLEPEPQQPARPAPAPARRPRPAETRPAPAPTPAPDPGVTVAAGTGVKVVVSSPISSETAQPGDTWSGTVKEAVIVGDRVAIPAGSLVTGVVTGAREAEKGSRAFLVLALKSVEVNGKVHALPAGTDSIIAGSTRARNLGAIAGGAAAGALIGKAVGGSNKGALIGGLVGGAAATGAVAASKGYQVELKEGVEMTFNVNQAVVMK